MFIYHGFIIARNPKKCLHFFSIFREQVVNRFEQDMNTRKGDENDAV